VEQLPMMFKAILAASLTLATYKEDCADSPEKVAQMNAISSAVAEFARTPTEAAFLITWGRHETNFSLRVHSGNCRAWECDRGRARGPFQVHRLKSMSDETWDRMRGVENTRAQVEVASKFVRWSLAKCKGDVRCSFRLLGGIRRDVPLKGEDARVASFDRMKAAL
jgi:hypothetical protein